MLKPLVDGRSKDVTASGSSENILRPIQAISYASITVMGCSVVASLPVLLYSTHKPQCQVWLALSSLSYHDDKETGNIGSSQKMGRPDLDPYTCSHASHENPQTRSPEF